TPQRRIEKIAFLSRHKRPDCLKSINITPFTAPLDKLVIIPTYNEKENVERMIREVLSLGPDYELLIVDDASPDGTQDVVRSLQKVFEGRLHLMGRAGKLGLGTAYIAGFRWALEREYTYIFEMDADFSHRSEEHTS